MTFSIVQLGIIMIRENVENEKKTRNKKNECLSPWKRATAKYLTRLGKFDHR